MTAEMREFIMVLGRAPRGPVHLVPVREAGIYNEENDGRDQELGVASGLFCD
jgi:hypothetical protein